MSLRNVGSGIAVLHAWGIETRARIADPTARPDLDRLRAQSRDLHVAPGGTLVVAISSTATTRLGTGDKPQGRGAGNPYHPYAMCGRFTLHEPEEDLVEQFAVTEVDPAVEVRPRWNIAPTQSVLAVTSDKEGVARRLSNLRWGLVPWWAKDPSIGNRMINARAETLTESRAYRTAFGERRCLIPASGFYEWQKLDRSGGKRGRSHPFYAQPAAGGVLALAGLWEIWRDEDDDVLRTCTVITTQPNAALSVVHDRMPVIIAPDAWSRWLHPGPLSEEECKDLLAPVPDGLLIVSPVGEGVNDTRNDRPELVEPIAPPEGPLPFPE